LIALEYASVPKNLISYSFNVFLCVLKPIAVEMAHAYRDFSAMNNVKKVSKLAFVELLRPGISL